MVKFKKNKELTSY